MFRCAVFAISLAGIVCTVGRTGAAPKSSERSSLSEAIVAARNAAEASHRERLDALARWCEERKMTEAAKLVRGWLPQRDPHKGYIFKLPDRLSPPEHLGGTDEDTGEFWRRFVALRTAQADGLFELSKQGQAAKDYALAFDLVREACRENPEHAQARVILGYVRRDGMWVLPDSARRLAAGQTYHEKFGWLAAEHVERYEQGRRYSQGKWVSGEEDERLHNSIKSGWKIESEHYTVTTNHSLEEGVRLSRRLENLYDVWRHVFVDYVTPQAEMQRWFERAEAATGATRPAAAPSVVRRLHQVIFYRNRDEYKTALRPLQPQIDITLGIYFAQPRTAYFFADDEQYAGTLFHEGTHQLFQETRQTGKDVGAKSNFALIEAAACYMESLVEFEYWYTLGGADEGRVPAARKRLLEDRFYVPLAEVTALGMRDLQHDERLPKIYSQISGQALFLLQADGGRYRRAFVDCLAAVYTNKADAGTLAKLTGKSYEQLDSEYRTFMQTMNVER